MAETSVRGRFVWHELMTTDTKNAADFFTKVAGWKTQPAPHDPSYTMFLADRRPVAGVMTLPAEAKAMGAPPNWLVYVSTPSVDDTARQAASLGAKVLRQPADIPTIGRFAIIQDPQGAVFAIFTPAPGSPPPNAALSTGDFSWHELATTDWRTSFAFYQQLFGWEPTHSMEMGPDGTYQMYGLGGSDFGGFYNKRPQTPGPPSWLSYIRVPDSTKTAETVKKLGGRIMSGPMQVPGGDWVATGADRQGAAFAVHSLKQATPAKAASSARPKTKTKAKAKAKAQARPKRRAARAASKPRMKAKVKAKAKATKRRAGKKARRR